MFCWVIDRLRHWRTFREEVLSTVPITVAEMAGFRKYAPKCMSESERREFINFIARNPTDGSLIAGTGGVRKSRWAAGNRGKSGGIRVIYYYHDNDTPIFLLTVYQKSKKSALSDAEKANVKSAIAELKSKIRNNGGSHE